MLVHQVMRNMIEELALYASCGNKSYDRFHLSPSVLKWDSLSLTLEARVRYESSKLISKPLFGFTGVFPRFTPLFLTNDELVVHLLSGSSFPCLGKLTTNKCKGIMSTPSCPGHLKICCPQLKDVQVVKVVDNLEISGMGLEKLQVEECLSNGSTSLPPIENL